VLRKRPSVLELFDVVETQLAAALRARHTLIASQGDRTLIKRAELDEQRLRRLAAALEAELDSTKSDTLQ
jgi:hypothetical protein